MHATETNETNISNEHKIVKNPTCRRQTNWLFTKHDRGFELGTTEKQILLVAGWRPWTRELQITNEKWVSDNSLSYICLKIFGCIITLVITLGANVFPGSLFFLLSGAREIPDWEAAQGDGVSIQCVVWSWERCKYDGQSFISVQNKTYS